jgi:hypothetical protein
MGQDMKFTGAGAIENYLPASGTPAALNADLIDPTSSSSGQFGGEVLALRLNVDFSAAGITQGPGGPFGALTLTSTGMSLDGQTVLQVLAAMNTALGGGNAPVRLQLHRAERSRGGAQRVVRRRRSQRVGAHTPLAVGRRSVTLAPVSRSPARANETPAGRANR